MIKKRENRLPKLKAYLEVVSLALTILEKIKTFVAPLLTSLMSKGMLKLLITTIPAVIKFMLPFNES